MTKLIELHTENVKRCRAVSLQLVDGVTIIEGPNGAGKTSVIDSIWYALCGANVHPPEVLRRGAEKGVTRLNFGDFVVERKYTPKNTSLLVTMKDGTKVAKPQEFLDALVGDGLAFDLSGLMQMKGRDLADMVRKLIGFDSSALDAKRAALADQKSETNRRGQEMKARLDAMPPAPSDTPDQPVSVDALLDEQSQMQAQKEANDKVRAEARRCVEALNVARDAVPEAGKLVERLEREIEAARARFAEAQRLEQRLVEAKVAACEAAEKLKDPDVADIYRRMRGAEAINQAVRAKKERAQLAAELDALRLQRDKLTSDIDRVEEQKREKLREQKFPVDGLGFGLDGLTFKDVPLEQASDGERLRVLMAIGIALNKALRLVLIRNGSLFDSKGLALVGQMAAEAQAQVIVERVADKPGTGFFIEDGELVESAPGPARENLRIVDVPAA